MNKWCEKEINQTIKAIADLSSSEELCSLLELILTPREINDMARRHRAIGMLKEGRSYGDIKLELGLSSSTISRISSGVGFGFRRCESTVSIKKSPVKPEYRRTIKYKGVPGIIKYS